MRLWDNAGALKRINSSLYLLAAVGLIAAAVMWMMNSPYFPVKLVKIDGDLHRLSATQLQQAVGLQNFAAIVKAHPQNGKPGYAVITLPNGNAALVEVRAISLPENSKQQLPELRQQVAGRNTEAFYRQYLQVLQRKYPIQHGSQKLDRDEN